MLKAGFHIKFRVTTSKDKIINTKNKYDEMVSYFLGIDIWVRMASRKTSVKEKAIVIPQF